MNKISSSGVVFVCIFILTHHSGITASAASDLSSSPAQMAVTGGKEPANMADTPATRSVSVAGDGVNKPTDLFAIENELEEGSEIGDDTSIVPGLEPDGQSIGGGGSREGRRRLTRSFFYTYPYDATYSNLYGNYGGYYPYYSTYPAFYKLFGIGYNPYYYGYSRVILG